jgi:hypothetical protein
LARSRLPILRFGVAAGVIAEEFCAHTGGLLSWDATQTRYALKQIGYSKKHFTEVAVQRHTRTNALRTAGFLEFRGDGRRELWLGPRLRATPELHPQAAARGAPHTAAARENKRDPPLGFLAGGFNAERYAAFFHEAAPALARNEVRYVLMDNAALRDGNVVRGLVNAKRGARARQRKRAALLFQPSYSPHWNPAELVLGNLKQVARHDAAAMRCSPDLAIAQTFAIISSGALRNFAALCGVY